MGQVDFTLLTFTSFHLFWAVLERGIQEWLEVCGTLKLSQDGNTKSSNGTFYFVSSGNIRI